MFGFFEAWTLGNEGFDGFIPCPHSITLEWLVQSAFLLVKSVL
jgi:hypothetical protein